MCDSLSVYIANKPLFSNTGSFITAFSALIGVIIGSLFSYFIARLQFRATALSANRQSWINTLRDSISEMQQLASITYVENSLATDNKTKNSADPEAFSNALRKMDFLYYKIQLLLNPIEDDHNKLIDLVFKLKGEVLKSNDEQLQKYSSLQDDITKLSQSILKREWKRVKKGK
ncbi:MAG: hypothetical protein HY964_05015 [Ignavibacteriales bacterium]|nr:hypothetical protein [Ignavibacteriales bacterium]